MEEMNLTRQKELAKRISQLNYEYYVMDAPSVSDAEWDALYEEFARLEAESGVILPDSPSQRVGGEPLASFERHTHLAKLCP